MKKFLLFFFPFCIAFYSQVDTVDYLSYSLEDLLNIKVTTSSNTEQEIWETSSRLILIDAKTIQQRGYQDLTDILLTLPYFNIQSQYGHWTKGGLVNFRGHRSGDSGNNRILVLLNGNRLTDAGGEGLYMGMNSLPLKGVEQVEILYGPNSTIYGKSAYAAVINIKTNTKTDKYAGINYGTYNSLQYYGGMTNKFDDNSDFYFNIFNYKSDEQDPTKDCISYINRHIFPDAPYTEVFYRATKNLIMNTGFNYKNFSLRYSRFDVEGSETFGGNPDFYVSEYSSQIEQTNQYISASLKLDFNKNFKIDLIYNFKNNEFDPRTANLYTGDLSRGLINKDGLTIVDPLYAYGGRKYYYFRTNSHLLQVQSEYTTDNLTLQTGIEADFINGIPVISEGKGGKPIVTDEQRKKYQHTFENYSIYSEVLYKLNKTTRLSAGGRLTKSSNNESFFIPRIAFIKKWDEQIFKVIFSKGFLIPSVTQKYFESLTTFSWIQPTPDLRTEKNTSLEFDWMYHNSGLSLAANVFYNWLSDGIIESVSTGDSARIQIDNNVYYVPVLKSQNLANGNLYGAAISAQYNFNENWQLQLNYSFIDGIKKYSGIEQHINNNLIPKHSFNTNLSFVKDNFVFNLESHYQSAFNIYSDHRNTLYKTLVDKNGYLNFDPYLIFNFNFRYNKIISQLDFYITVKNLFNIKYYGQAISANWGSPKILQDLRRFTFGVEYGF